MGARKETMTKSCEKDLFVRDVIFLLKGDFNVNWREVCGVEK